MVRGSSGAGWADSPPSVRNPQCQSEAAEDDHQGGGHPESQDRPRHPVAERLSCVEAESWVSGLPRPRWASAAAS